MMDTEQRSGYKVSANRFETHWTDGHSTETEKTYVEWLGLAVASLFLAVRSVLFDFRGFEGLSKGKEKRDE